MQRSSSASFPGTPGERDDYLSRLGERVREERARRGMTRRILARDSGLSERYLAQLESGKGNLSIKLLRRVGDALNLPLPRLLGGEPAEPVELGGSSNFCAACRRSGSARPGHCSTRISRRRTVRPAKGGSR
jgi:transcriptional regulator with XRE-family HTH domain